MNKIIFVNRYYCPDHSATSQILTDLAEYLAANGIHVLVVTSRLAYDKSGLSYSTKEVINGVHVHRVWTTAFGRSRLILRAIDYLTFYLSSFLMLLRTTKAGDTLVAKTDPPLISVIAAVVCKVKGAKLVNWIQDLFPEVAQALGVSIVKGPVFRILRWLRNIALLQAKKNIVLGKRMQERLLLQGIPAEKIEVVHNWVVGGDLSAVPRTSNPLRLSWGLEDKFVVGYSGNLGRAHDYETILGVINDLKDQSDIVFVFIGGGAGMELLRCAAEAQKLSNLIFKPYQPLSQLSEGLSVADVHLITLQPQMEGLIVPSKFYGILSVNRPLLFIGDIHGEIAELITSVKCGFAAQSGQTKMLSDWILRIHSDATVRSLYEQNARSLHNTKFADGASRGAWLRLLNS